MSKLFSASTMGFYDTEFSLSIPTDAFEISDELHEQLVSGPSHGLQLSLNAKNKPCLIKVEQDSNALATMERRWRDTQLSLNEWLVTRHRDDREMSVPSVLTDEQFAELLVYRRALRDWPESELFPKVSHRPAEPVWLESQLVLNP